MSETSGAWRRSPAADLWNQEDFAGRGEGREQRVLVDLAVDGNGHPPLDVLAEPRVAPIELANHIAHRAGVDLELGDISGEGAARRTGGDDAGHGQDSLPPMGG